MPSNPAEIEVTSDFEQLVFSGGGVRCFWYGGFLEAVSEQIGLKPKRVAGVSGGALSAACFIGDCGRSLLDNMTAAFQEVEKNVDVTANGSDEALMPHQQVYRRVVEQTVDAQVVSAVCEGPAFQIQLGHPPSQRFTKLSTWAAMAAYVLDLKLRSSPYLRWTNWLGVTRTLVDARQAARDGKLVDLICCAAVIPPVFESQRWNGRPVIDGGFACKAPMPEPDEGRTLILLTRRFRNLPAGDRRVFVQVSRDTPAHKLDFTDSEKLRQTWELGRKDGQSFLASQSSTESRSTAR